MKNCQLRSASYHVHLDGYNLIPFFKGEVKDSPRKDFLYWSDDGDLFAIRYDRWKVTFYEQNREGLDVWMKDYEKLRVPKIFDLRADPFERGDSSFLYDDWMVHRVYFAYGAQAHMRRQTSWALNFNSIVKNAHMDVISDAYLIERFITRSL